MTGPIEIPEGVALLAATIFTTVGTVWSLAWWLSNKFATLTALMNKQKEDILSKLEYHERHDDTRFERVSRDLFSIQLKQVAGLKDLKKVMNDKEEV